MIFIKIKLVFLLFTLSLSTLANTNVKSDDSSSDIEKIILKVAVEEVDYFPFNYNDNGEMKGFSVDVLKYIEANSKYDFDFVELPWPRALHLVAQGEVDLILTLFRTSKREPKYHYIEPSYANEVNQLFTLIDNKFKFYGQLQELTPYSIGTKREYSYGESFDGANYLKKLPVLTEEILLNMLLGGRIDMIIGNPFAFNEIISKKNVNAKVRAITPYVAITPVYMALTRQREDSQEVKKKFDQLTAKLKASPYYTELLNKYKLNF